MLQNIYDFTLNNIDEVYEGVPVIPIRAIQNDCPWLHRMSRIICKVEDHESVLPVQGCSLDEVTARIGPVHHTILNVKGQAVWECLPRHKKLRFM